MQYPKVACSALIAALLALAAPAARAGGPPVSLPSSEWDGNAVLSVQIPGLGKAVVPASMDIAFGPIMSLDGDDFSMLVVIDLGGEVHSFEVEGSYQIDAKGKPALTPDLAELESETLDLLLYLCNEVFAPQAGFEECELLEGLDLSFDPRKQKMKVKGQNKQGVESLRAAATLPFVASVPGDKPVKVKLSVKGDGALERSPQ